MFNSNWYVLIFYEMASVKKKNNAMKGPSFNIYLNLDVSKERFLVKNVTAETKIKELKTEIELVAGIPYNIQRLHYLDKSDMAEESDLKQNDVVAGGTLDLKLWKMWETVVKVVVKGDVKETLSLGLTMDKDWEKLDRAFFKHKVETAKEKLQVALLIAAHRNNTEVVNTLLDLGANINYKTVMGRTALHMAASQGNSECIDLMLKRGASIEMVDVSGKTPITTANEWGMKDSERHLFLFQWQTRATKANTKTNSNIMMHQKFDSSLPTWLRGNYGQIYHANILPPGEFSGTVIAAPRRKPVKTKAQLEAPPEVGHEGSISRLGQTSQKNGGAIETFEEEREDSFNKSATKETQEGKEGSTKLSKTQTTINTNISANDGSRYCKGGYFINSQMKNQTRTHSPTIYVNRKSVPSSASSKASTKLRK